MTHTQGIIEQLRITEEDDELPAHLRASASERRKELEREDEDDDE